MKFKFCPNCGLNAGFKRAFGIGTLIMLVLTGGIWLLALPFYECRCIRCGGTKYEEIKGRPDDNFPWAK